MRVQKTVSLTPDTMKITQRIGINYHSGFSGWLRATLRQYNEDHDPIKAAIYTDSILRALKNHDNLDQVLKEAAEIRRQATLEVFE